MKLYQIILIYIVVVGIILGGFVAVKYTVGTLSCKAKAVSFEAYEYGWFSGCMVKHKGRWLPLENIRGFDDK